MVRALLFFILVYSFDVARAAVLCSSLFELHEARLISSPLSTQNSYPELRAKQQTWDVAEHGLVVRPQDLASLKAVQKLLSERDGTYPLIIDKNLNLVIDHRLPNIETPMDQAYVGNHRGLYQKLSTVLNSTPEVVFAGQLRVIGGRVTNITDQSGTFYFLPENFGFSGPHKMIFLVEKNQQRLDQVVDFLKSLDILTSATEVINFMEAYQGYEPEYRNEGHLKAKDAAFFERFCRATPSCWAKHQAIDKHLRRLSLIGTRTEIIKFLLTEMPGTIHDKFETIQFWNIILKEGTIDMLSLTSGRDPNTLNGQLIENFIKSLEQIP